MNILLSIDPQENQTAARQILEQLPEWFEGETSREAYILGCADKPVWICKENGHTLGFLALKETSSCTAEIYVMGVVPQLHRRGIGRALFSAFYAYAKTQGYKFLQVKTVDAGYYECYDRTRRFYESLGFARLEVFPTLWDAANPCLVMIMHVQ